MPAQSVLYDLPSFAIAGLLLVCVLLFNEGAFRVGQRRRAQVPDSVRTQSAAIQAAMLGLLALLLGFAFSMALQRFDARSQAVLSEANAIGTALLRTSLLPDTQRPEMEALFREYIALRVASARLDLTAEEAHAQLQAQTAAVQRQLWARTTAAARAAAQPVNAGLYVQAVNDMYDAYDARKAAVQKHVPEEVVLLLFAVVLVGTALLGYTSGLNGARALIATGLMTLLIVLTILIVLDLDRPRRGMIQVNQQPILALETMLPPATATGR